MKFYYTTIVSVLNEAPMLTQYFSIRSHSQPTRFRIMEDIQWVFFVLEILPFSRRLVFRHCWTKKTMEYTVYINTCECCLHHLLYLYSTHMSYMYNKNCGKTGCALRTMSQPGPQGQGQKVVHVNAILKVPVLRKIHTK